MVEKSKFVEWLIYQTGCHGMVTERWLADVIGVSQSTIHRIFSGERQPTMPEVIAMVWAFGEEEHIEDILRMAGYDRYIETLYNYRLWAVLQHQENPAICRPREPLPHHYWKKA